MRNSLKQARKATFHRRRRSNPRAMMEPRAALAAIGQLVDSEIDIGNAALQLARVDAPDADWQAAARHLSDLAQGSVKRAATMDKQDLPPRAAALSDLLAREFGYSGDVDAY